MERTPFRTLKNAMVNIRLPTRGELEKGLCGPGDVLVVTAGASVRVVAIVSQDHLFDADGNRFSY